MRSGLGVACVAGLGVGASAADDWSRFRGPNGGGVSAATGLPADLDPGRAL